MSDERRKAVRALAHDAIRQGDPLAWYEQVYALAEGKTGAVPWADLAPNEALVDWFAAGGDRAAMAGRRALVVGCGLGDDAEWLAAAGADVVAFDIAPTAIAWCKRRFPTSKVDYQIADLLAPPASHHGAFDFVFEAYTLQALAPEPRAIATANLAKLVAPGGVLLLVARAADEPSKLEDGPPWALTRAELEAAGADLERLPARGVEDGPDGEGVRRLRVAFQRMT
ncbi:MAG: class I SAM-dependent methyltransferase [Labilithrix sp.]|nr:class I SAM-dependent methyltransferase [Labilithrix sp.]